DRTAIDIVYDVCHNIAKFEELPAPQSGRSGSSRSTRRMCIYPKESPRAYPPGHPETPAVYRDVGQPVLIPGDMGRYSYVLVGTARAYEDTFASTCHG